MATKKAPAERVYEESVEPLSVTERLWLVEKIISELRRHSAEGRRRPVEPGAEPAPRPAWSDRFRATLGQIDQTFERPAPLPRIEREPLDG